jgi:hypothetical protein
MANKHVLLNAAEVFDSWRIIPRLFLGLTFWWTVYLTDKLIGWYIHLPHVERGIEASGFASVVQVGVLAFLKKVYDTYSENGRDWNQRPPNGSPPGAPST